MKNTYYNKIYARVNNNSVVTHIFSEAFEQPTEQDICIDETNTDRHGANAYKAYDENGIANYEIESGKLVEHDKSLDFIARQIEDLRRRRELECFPYINRGNLWYDTLSTSQIVELQEWYQDWLNVTETLWAPAKPEWLK